VSSREMKLILALLVLLTWPCLGAGSRAQASFAFGRSALAPERIPGSPGFEFRLILSGDEPVEPDGAPPSSGLGEEITPVTPRDASRGPAMPAHLFPIPGGFSTGTTSTGIPSSGPGPGPGLPFVLPLGAETPRAGLTGLLFLANERFNPPPFASRLFRPPRLV
jgi:hypothetical protein